jgi:anti-sigma regulatory factor (Ser/Thr protein kinase)
MRAIIVIERAAKRRDVPLTISPPPGDITDLLRVTGIADHTQLSPRAGDAPPPSPFLERIEIELPREPLAPGRARADLREAMNGRLSETDQATATLLTSELVTNAVIHPDSTVPGPIALRIATYADRLRVEVIDAGSGFDLTRLPPRPREDGGHGLIVVDGLSSRWGTSRRAIPGGEGFCVWFELDVSFDRSAALSELEPSERPLAAAEG